VSWLYAVVRRQAMDHIRVGARARARATDVEVDTLEGAPSETIGRTCPCLRGALARLSPDRARAIQRGDLDGEPPSTWGPALGLTRNAAAVRLHRARNALRAQLEATCGACAGAGCLDCTCHEAEPRPRSSRTRWKVESESSFADDAAVHDA
jgi:RNA polymerase sigma-70 factor (ECF subfamily)